jgi:Flp pilus assembly protein TadB
MPPDPLVRHGPGGTNVRAVSKHRRGGTGRYTSAPSRYTEAQGRDTANLPTAGTSIAEIAVYGLFAAAVAGVVLVLGGHPRWVAGVVVAGAVILVIVLLLASTRVPRQQAASTPFQPQAGPSTGGRRGRRRRR